MSGLKNQWSSVTKSKENMSQAESENLESENIARRETVEGLTNILMDQYPLHVENRGMGLRSQFPICGLDGSAGDTGMLWCVW